MKIIETRNHRGDLSYEGSIDIELQTEEKTLSVKFGRGEPEDFCLARDLSDAFRISTMLKLAYNAGKNGESLEIIEKDEEEE